MDWLGSEAPQSRHATPASTNREARYNAMATMRKQRLSFRRTSCTICRLTTANSSLQRTSPCFRHNISCLPQRQCPTSTCSVFQSYPLPSPSLHPTSAYSHGWVSICCTDSQFSVNLSMLGSRLLCFSFIASSSLVLTALDSPPPLTPLLPCLHPPSVTTGVLLWRRPSPPLSTAPSAAASVGPPTTQARSLTSTARRTVPTWPCPREETSTSPGSRARCVVTPLASGAVVTVPAGE